MNKLTSFWVSFAITMFVTLLAMIIWGESQKELRVPMLIVWYMFWKLLHDKDKGVKTTNNSSSYKSGTLAFCMINNWEEYEDFAELNKRWNIRLSQAFTNMNDWQRFRKEEWNKGIFPVYFDVYNSSHGGKYVGYYIAGHPTTITAINDNWREHGCDIKSYAFKMLK